MAYTFVTGGSGLVGQFLLSELLRRGERVRASFRGERPAALPGGAPAGAVEWVEGDVLDPLFLQQAIAGAATVYHCAAIVSYNPADADRLWDVNVTGTANVVDALLTCAPGARLGYVSSVAALGGSAADGAITLDERATWDPDASHSAYSESKYAAELEVWRGMSEGLAAVIVNPSVILGPADPRRSSTQLFRYAAGRHRFYPLGQLNVVDVRDVVAALLDLTARAELLGERYVLNGGTLPYGEFFRLAAEALDAPPPATALPAALAEVLWRVEKVRGWLTGSAPLLTRDTARLSRRAVTFDAARVRARLGMSFRTPEESIRWVAQELKGRL